MIITKRLTGLVVIAAVLLTACGKKAPSYTKYIPKSSSNIISVDVKSLLVKLNSDSLTIENMTAVLKDGKGADNYTEAMNKYKEFKDAGIDWDSKLYISTGALDFNSYNRSFEIQVVGGMKDAKKFEDFLKKQKETGEIIKGDGYSYAKNDEMAIGWNSEVVMIVYGSAKKSYDSYEDMVDSAGLAKPKSADVAGGPVEKLKKYFKLSTKESIISVDGFNDLQGKTADIAIFNQLNLDGINAMAFAFVPKVKDLLEGSFSSTIINFEDGKIKMESTSTTGKKMAAILKKYAGPEVDMGLLENYPSQNVDGVMAFSFKPELVPALIKETGLDALVALGLGSTGMSMDDMAKIFKGDFAVAVSDFAVAKQDMGKDAMDTYRRDVPTAKMIFVAKIGDKAMFDKLVALGEKQGFIIRNGSMLVIASNGQPEAEAPVVISIANDQLTVASDLATLQAYQAKSQKIGLSDDAKSKIKGNAVGLFVDVEKILNGISSNVFDSSNAMAANVMAKSKATFKNFSFGTNNISGSSVTGKGEIVFGDAKKNSLVQIVRYGMYVAEQQKLYAAAQAKKYEEEQSTTVTSDSIVTEAPMEQK